MENIVLKIRLFKYGEFKESENYSFASKQQLEIWIQNQIAYTEQLSHDSSDCGENLSKWTCKFEYNNNNYNLDLEI